MTRPPASGYQESQQGAWLSIATYLLLTSVKLGVGWWANSQALLADGLNNLTDVISSVAVLFGLRIAVRPADADHRYGHQKAETVSAIVVASVMGLVGLDVAVAAVRTLFSADLAQPHPAAIWVSVGSGLVMFGVYLHNIGLARRTGSRALAAAAYDNRSDALTSLGAALGIFGAQLGWRWTDPVAGGLVALIIIRTAWHIGVEAAHRLTDGFDVLALEQIRQRVAGVEGVVHVRDVRARYLGNEVAVEVTIGVPPALSLLDAHRVSDQVERTLAGFMEIVHVHVHMEPALLAAVTGGR